MQRVAIIMAGGSGERFWPLSRTQRPKQLLRLADESETLLQEAVTRITPLIPGDNVFIATSTLIQKAIRGGDERVPAKNVLAEPCKRNTAGCLIWAAAEMMARYGDPSQVVMAVLTADHKIGDHAKFLQTIDAAMTAAEENDALVTIGIPPARPDTGYGYIEIDTTAVQEAQDAIMAHRVRRFREKPNREQAEEFVASGNFYWNSGMFFWRVDMFLNELRDAHPEMERIARSIAEALRDGYQEEAERLFETLENISIDYALLEKSHSVLAVRSLFEWDDVGSWDSLSRTFARDDQGNVAFGSPVLIDVKDSVIFNEDGEETAVAVIGLENVVVVTTPDGVLVASKDRAQDVREAVKELKKRSAKQL